MNTMTTQLGQRNGAPAGAMDVWNQNAGQQQLGMPMGPPPPAPASPVQMVQRLLRGRIALAVVLAGIGAIIGAGAGYMAVAPQFKAQGLIAVSPFIPLVEGEKPMAMYMQMMSSEAFKIASPQILDKVPQFEPWKTVVGNNPAALGDLSANLKTAYQKNSFNIGLEYATADANVAAAGVQSVIKAYQAQFKQSTNDTMAKRVNEMNDRKAKTQAAIDDAQKQIDGIIAVYGTSDLQAQASAAQSKVEDIDKEKRGYENNYKAASDFIAAQHKNGGKIALEDLALVDDGLKKMIADLQAAQLKEKIDEANLGPNHRIVVTERATIVMYNAAVNERADLLRNSILAIIPDYTKGGSGTMLAVTAGPLKGLETRVNTLNNDLKVASEQRTKIATDAGAVATQQTLIHKLTNELQPINESLETLQYQSAMTGELQILQPGNFAAKASDKKIVFGLAGALGGAAVPVGLLMLLGLMDTRFRYSDDAAGQSMAGIPLLGILPNLPDRLSDPAQASIAAHCVHQIRTMLQLNAMRDHSTAFAITSASSGDGKTSLSLALGLSFAASGSRTLLIDADLVGGGLTSRLGNESSVGIVDALAGVGLEECVQPTDVADLSLLPIGGAQAHHAGSFSPPAVRKLLAEIRKHYEVIVIDTGPVMGSIEATPICASVDGVVLTVARGQSRPLVERAITHLQSIGARVAGVVFNRAQHKDFEQSIGAISIRSAARSTKNGTGHNGRKDGLGAVASAVAGNVGREN